MNENIACFDPSSSGARADYYANVRKFKNGGIEMVIKPIRPMQWEQAKKRFEESGARTPGFAKAPVELSDEQKQANHNRAVRRAKQSIRFLCKEACMDRLLTLTYRENMQDRERVLADFTRFVRLLRKRIGEWVYVAVLELQSRGAYHIHCAVRGWQQISVIRACWYKAIGGRGNEKGDQTPGQVDVTSPKGARRGAIQWQADKLAGYLTKYLAKTFEFGEAEKRRYWAAKGLQKAEPYRIWIAASNVADAIREGVNMLRTFEGLRPGFVMWLSASEDSFWLAGTGDT